ncbi:hypothetical protein FB45DRAFT_925669 [Roridomyces roridus]|uniref:Uncharacterized protein n=1 Tax=Roridomyces roridus TaxID=1738132 RepID=A0AAD7BJY9_9AGAR|nr:hypothetical protein FB45DRAFT_925669 [Roridomyces roridus]
MSDEQFEPIPLGKPQKPRYSIDLSLELESQLMESPPPTPAAHVTPPQQHIMQMPDIDPHVLAHIISQLRHQLTDMTRERDDLLGLLSVAHTKEAQMEDTLQAITEKAMSLEESLSESRKKNNDDEEAISLLRTKVEESRRGLMRLQAESSRRPAALDTNRANAPSSFMGPPSSKRASFTPLTGSFNAKPNAHRRISSVSDSHVSLSVPDPSEAASQPNRRMSGFFARASPPRQASPDDELEKLRNELRSSQAALEETRAELSEATEAREASDSCVTALRAFITENNIAGAVKLPPLPVGTTGEEPDTQKKGWGFKLWKVDTTVKGAPGPPSSNATASPVIGPTGGATPVAGAPLSRKITGFWGSRGSISSTEQHRQSVYSVSDASSVAEPISPTSLGGGADVRVRDVNGSPEMAGTPEDMKPSMPIQGDDVMSLRSEGI